MDCFVDRLASAVRHHAAPVVVGLDPRAERIPESLLSEPTERASFQAKADACFSFCCGVIDVVSSLVPAVKPQAAFFEQFGPAGTSALWETIRYARSRGLLVILDAKRNDIGSTAAAYAAGLLGPGERSPWGADALTVSPYLGDDSLKPFVETAIERTAGIFVLVKTSNPGGQMIQDLVADGRPIYEHVANHVESLARSTVGGCGYGAVGAVVGATHPAQLAQLREQMPHTWFLVPGFGAQGGTAADTASAFDSQGMGAIVNSSRSIIFAYHRPEYQRFGPARWQEAIDAATKAMIDAIREQTPAGKLHGLA